MFDTFYSFRYVNSSSKNIKGQFVKEHKLTFCCNRGHQYIVNVEQYEYHLFAIKFYLKAHRFSQNKYKLLTNHHNIPPIIRTCVEIMLYFLKHNPYASFCFVGENSFEESVAETKRFKVYKRVMENHFSPLSFWHLIDTNRSFYLLQNKLSNTPEKMEDLIHSLLS